MLCYFFLGGGEVNKIHAETKIHNHKYECLSLHSKIKMWFVLSKKKENPPEGRQGHNVTSVQLRQGP